MSLPLDQRPLTGCRFEATPTPAAEYGARPGAAFPAHVDLRAYCSPVEDQSRTNSCTANAIVGALEYLQRRNGQPATDLSRLFVYYNARQLAGAEGADVGSFIHHVMAAVLAHGACEERMWPFQEAMCLVRPTQAAYRDAQRFQAVQYARTPLGDAALAALASGLPVVFGTYAPRGHYDVAGATGAMPGPGATLERPGGGHAMLLVGYDLGREEWLVRNSWGPRWAEGGYFRIPFATLRAYSDPAHFWTIGAIDAAPMLLGKVAAPTAEALGATAQPSAPTLDTARLRSDARSAVDDLRAKTEESRQSLRDRLRGN